MQTDSKLDIELREQIVGRAELKMRSWVSVILLALPEPLDNNCVVRVVCSMHDGALDFLHPHIPLCHGRQRRDIALFELPRDTVSMGSAHRGLSAHRAGRASTARDGLLRWLEARLLDALLGTGELRRLGSMCIEVLVLLRSILLITDETRALTGMGIEMLALLRSILLITDRTRVLTARTVCCIRIWATRCTIR